VQNLREMAYFKGHVIILSIDPSVFKERELRLLEKETKEVEPIHRGMLSEDLLEILRFIYRQNAVGIKPSYGDIKKEMGISKPTVKKRIRHLVVTGYLKDIEKGRTKIVETTEKGTSLFLR
jgi:DNA-binding MarR family transcriptional regulator